MIAQMISEWFNTIGHEWKTTGGYIEPSEEDVTKVLDNAAGRLYDSPVGTRLETGGLIIEKREYGFDVYCYLGNYI